MTDPVRPVAPRDYVWLLNEAKSRVRRSVLWKRFIDGTPLENDIAVWMADLASEAVDLAAAPVPCAASPADRQQVERMRQRVWNYINEDYDDDGAYAVDIMEDFLKMFGMDLPRTDPRATGEEARDAMDCPIHSSAWCSCKRDAEYSGRLNRLVESLRCPTCGTAVYQPNERCTAHGEQTNGQLEHQHSGHRVTPQSGESEGRESDGEAIRGGAEEGGTYGGSGDLHARRQGGHSADAPPVAVARDPHRLLTLEWFIERLRDRGNNWQQDADNWRHNRGQRTREKRGYEVLDACGGSLLELADGFAEELARLRGAAAVRGED